MVAFLLSVGISSMEGGLMIQRLLVCALVGSGAVSVSFGQTITETFEGGIPASWTIQDNYPKPIPMSPAFSAVPWTTNIAEGMLNFTDGGGTTGGGTAATASSANHPGQYDISLITPAFVLAADSSVRYTLNYYHVDAFEAFDTNISINGGPWIVMTHDATDRGAPYSTGPPKFVRTIGPLTFFGGVPGDIARVEFRYYSTVLLPMVVNQYVQIDDVRIPTPIPEPSMLVLMLLSVLAWTGRHRDWRAR
jgi:hypothetical protein